MAKNEAEKASSSGKKSKDWKAWLGEGTFYVHGMVYMLVRIAVNVTMTMQPFYLFEVTQFKGDDADDPTTPQLALVPLISYLMSMIFSVFIQRRMTSYLRNRMYPMFISIIVITLTSIPLAFLNEHNRAAVYPLAAI